MNCRAVIIFFIVLHIDVFTPFVEQKWQNHKFRNQYQSHMSPFQREQYIKNKANTKHDIYGSQNGKNFIFNNVLGSKFHFFNIRILMM